MRRTILTVTILAAATGCTSTGDVLFSPDAGPQSPAADAATGELPDSGVSMTPDSGVVTPNPDAGTQAQVWERLPGLHGGSFRPIGASGDTTFLLGRRLDESPFSVYRLDGSGSAERLGPATDENGPFFPPIGSLIERGTQLLWATEREGVHVSEDDGATWQSLPMTWEDGSVGDGNGHVSRIVDAWDSGSAFCVHREVTPWVDFRVLSDQLHNEVRCNDGAGWSTITSSIAEGVRFFTPFGTDLYGFTAPLYNNETGAPKFCHSADLGVNWSCRPTSLQGSRIHRTSSGRLVVTQWVDVQAPQPATHTQLWYSDDHGATWSLSATVPEPLTELTIAGELIYGVTFAASSVSGPLYQIQLTPPSVRELTPHSRAQVSWLELFPHRGELLAADTRGVRLYDAGSDQWSDVAIESMPALELATDPSGSVWTIDGSRIARRLRPGKQTWDELFFDDTGWGTGNVLDHARVYRMALIGERMFFGAGHRKLYQLDTDTPAPIVMEDQTLVAQIHPDAVVWQMSASAERLFVSVTGGEEVNHGNGTRVPWGGGVFRRSAAGQWSDASAGLPTRTIGGIVAPGIVAALHADGDLVLAGTHAGIYHSTDGGASWSRSIGFTDYDASEDPTSFATDGTHVFVAQLVGARSFLYVSTDGGASFSPAASLPPGQVRRIAAEPGRLFALLDGGGLLESTDAGGSWKPVGSVPNGAFPERTFALHVDATQILVGSADGVWRLLR